MTLKKVIKDIGTIGIMRMILRGRGIILLPILTKTLGASGYGLWVQSLATIGVAIPILRLGIPFSMSRLFPSKDSQEEISRDFYSLSFLVFLITSVVTLLIFVFPTPLANAIFEGHILVVRLVAIILLIYSLDKVMLSVFRAFREMKKYSILNVGYRYGEMFLAVSFVLLGYGVVGALSALLIGRGALLIVLLYMTSRRFTLSLPDLSRTKEYLDFGLPTIPSSISYWVISTSDRFLIGFFLSVTYVGYYNPGYSIGIVLPMTIVGIYGFVLVPTLSDYYENGKIPQVEQILGLSLKYFLLLSIPFFFGISLLYEPLLTLLTKPKIASEGGIIAVFTASTGIIHGIRNVFSQQLVLKKRTKVIGATYTIAAIVNVGGNIVLIPKIGIIGAGITTVLAYALAAIIMIYFSIGIEEISIDLEYGSYAKIIASSVIMALIVYSAKLYVWSNLFFLIALGVVAYFSVLYAIGGIEKKEIEFLKGMVG